jgi:endoglucanase
MNRPTSLHPGARWLKTLLTGLALLPAASLASETHPVSPMNEPESPSSAAPSTEFALGQGVNISHWLSQRGERMPPPRDYFTAEDVAFLKDRGFQHLRLPVDESVMWDLDGNRNPEAFAILETALGWIREAGMRAILDLHIIRSHHFNAANQGGENTLFTDPASEEHLADLWRDLSEAFGHWSTDFLAYELLNEAVADDPDDWNRVLARVIAALREKEPDRKLVVGSNRWQQVETFPDLVVPAGDRNLILSFHFYNPFLFTHYRASWIGEYGEYDGPIQYPGLLVPEDHFASLPDSPARHMLQEHLGPNNRQTLRAMMEPAIAYARKHRLPLYCGEWGALPSVPREDRLAWYRDMSAIFKAESIANAIWDYKGSFGIRDHATGEADTALVRAVIEAR